MATDSKTITVAALHAVAVTPVLQKLLQQTFSGRLAYHIGLLLAEISQNPRVAATDTARVATLKNYGVEKDGAVFLTAEQMPAFAEEFGPIASAMLTFNVAPLPMEILDVVKEMTPAEALALKPFLEA